MSSHRDEEVERLVATLTAERNKAKLELAEAMTHGERLSEIVLQFDQISPMLQEAISFFSFAAIKTLDRKP